tara:strand:- start:1087 stop:1389 length:303 start_codon:yes stop_codon:yes gene_type:complete
MVETSLNWASIMGIILCFTSSIFFIIYFLENERINLINNAIILVSFIGGLILSFKGWRLDPIGQFSSTIIILGIFLELVPLVYDFQKKNRTLKNSIKNND